MFESKHIVKNQSKAQQSLGPTPDFGSTQVSAGSRKVSSSSRRNTIPSSSDALHDTKDNPLEDEDDEEAVEDESEEDDNDEHGQGPSKRAKTSKTGTSKESAKKRRGSTMVEKKFICPSCDKAYGRMEHLYRHQLNRESRFEQSNSE